MLLLLCPSLSAGTLLGLHHEPMGSDSDDGDYESPATLLTVAIATVHSPNTRRTQGFIVKVVDPILPV